MDVSLRERGVLAFDGFRLDPLRRTLRRRGQEVALTARLFDTLLYLVQNPERLVTRDELENAVWGGRVVDEGNLQQAISSLRKALRAGGAAETVIVTVPGRGYRFAVPVRFEPEEPLSAGPGSLGSTEMEGSALTSRPSGWRRLAMAAGIGVFALAGGCAGLAWYFATPPARPAPLHPLVVLTRAENLTADPAFDRVLGRALAIDLGQSPYLSLISDAQVADTLSLMMRPADTKLTTELAGEVCARANGDVAVDATIAALGTRYVLILTATDCASGRIEAQDKAQVDGKDAVISALDTLAGRLRGQLGESAASLARFGTPLLPEKTASFDALRAYSDGFQLVAQGKRVEAITLFQHAIELDPNFAMAYAALATMQFNTHQEEQAAESIAKAYALRGLLKEARSEYAGLRGETAAAH